MKIFRTTLYSLVLTLLISSKSYSQESFVITSELLEIIPNEHLSFLEGFDETASFDTLENVEWSEKHRAARIPPPCFARPCPTPKVGSALLAPSP